MFLVLLRNIITVIVLIFFNNIAHIIWLRYERVTSGHASGISYKQKQPLLYAGGMSSGCA